VVRRGKLLVDFLGHSLVPAIGRLPRLRRAMY
jgi:hypothetical protein